MITEEKPNDKQEVPTKIEGRKRLSHSVLP